MHLSEDIYAFRARVAWYLMYCIGRSLKTKLIDNRVTFEYVSSARVQGLLHDWTTKRFEVAYLALS